MTELEHYEIKDIITKVIKEKLDLRVNCDYKYYTGKYLEVELLLDGEVIASSEVCIKTISDD